MDDRAAAQWPSLSVVSTSVSDAVHFAGGLIFDRVRLGWRVTVLLPTDEDSRPLRILGADVAHDASTRSEVDAALATKTTEAIVWGTALPTTLERGSKVVSYRLSRAALVFKGYALTAAGLDPLSAAPTETFRTTCASGVIASDLYVAG